MPPHDLVVGVHSLAHQRCWYHWWCPQIVGSPILQGIVRIESVLDAFQFDCQPRLHLALVQRPSCAPQALRGKILSFFHLIEGDTLQNSSLFQTDADPHNATRGFFFAHMGWLFVKKHKDVIEAGKKLNFDDLAEDSVVMFQKKFDPWFALFMCFVFPGLVCTLWGDNFWNGYWVAGALRYIFVLHVTWLVNSAAHFFGDHPYDPTSWPAENPIVSFLAVGEGWHNWHHKYPFDYAASEYGVDKQYNPTKLFIDVCCMLGLASDRKRATGAWSKLKATRGKEE